MKLRLIMKKVSKLNRTSLALALTVSFISMTVAPLGAGSSAPSVGTASNIAKSSSDKPQKFDISQGFSSVAEKAITAVVNVSTTQIVDGGGRQGKDGLPQFAPGSPFEELFQEFFDQMQRPRKVQSLGSGFIIQSEDTSAIIVTNYHVIADAKKVTVFLNDNTELEATTMAFDERTDIALLKVKTDTLPVGKRKLPVMDWGDSHAVKVGDWILAIGNPFGLGSTVTSGIISNRSRDIMLGRGGKSRVNDYVDDFMQHDAAINMGNSGGPLLDLQGKVIGINTAIFSPSGGNIGIGFAIPSAVAQDTVNQLLKFGRTKRGWLGVRIQVVTDDIAESLGLGKAKGAIIGSVTPDGPAAKAKIEPEDIILEFDGKEVNEKARLSRLVGETTVGKSVKVKIWRKGKEMSFDVVLGEFETAPDRVITTSTDKAKSAISREGIKVLGLTVSELTPELRKTYNLAKDLKGIMVMQVEPNTPGDDIKLNPADTGKGTLVPTKPGDIIQKVNQQELTKPEEFAKAVDEAKKLKRENILLLVMREGEPRFVPMKLESEDLTSSSKDKSKSKDKEKNKDKDKENDKDKSENKSSS
ncbi:MAG: Do family serine endopeptidase [Alphaproteobacteria bacterium]|nr:Do family serine endopeptidase [Alphaproteobacteria bacterium]